MRNRFKLTALFLLPVALQAQSGNPDTQQILDRLQKLEEQNRELMSEIQALRQELTSKASVPPSDTHLDERVAVNEQRIQDQDQSKLESEHKLPVRLTGMLLFNAFANGRNSGFEYPNVASINPGTSSDGATLRQSVVGLKFDGPQIFGGGKVSGSVFLDFWGGTGTSLNSLVRLRVASIDFTWPNTTFSAGQDKPILAPREPTSLAQVGVSPLTGAGNLWLWQPQVRAEQRFNFGYQAGLRAQAGVYQTSESYASAPASYSISPARPALEGRFEFWRQFGGDSRIEIAPGFHTSESHVDGQSVPSRVVSVDWLIRPVHRVELTGMFFSGENTSVLGGLRQGISFRSYDRIAPVHSVGGWAQLTLRATSRLSFNLYGGEEDPRNSDLLNGNIGRNLTYAGNVMYRIGSNVLTSFEASQTRTFYLGTGLRLNPHYDLAIAYLY